MEWAPIKLSPVEYVNRPGILKDIEEILDFKNYQHATILTDDNVIAALNGFVAPDFFTNHPVIKFAGSCTYEEAARVESLVPEGTDVLVALGGGQLLDTAKNTVDELDLDLINVPTLPSNCASIATKSMMYSEGTHELNGRERHRRAVDLVLVDPKFLRTAPTNYLLSGIGDTLAKWYEIRRRLQVPEAEGPTLDIARRTIEISKERTISIESLNELDDAQIFSDLLDTIYLVAASVDGFAVGRGRSVGAHSFHNAYLTIEHHPVKTHGEIVAFGVLTQLAAEKEFDEIDKVVNFYDRIGLPSKLSDLGLTAQTAAIRTIAEDIVAPDNIRIQSVYPDLTADEMETAINYFRG